MFVDEKPFIWVWRPFYHRVYAPLYVRVLGPVLDRIFERIAQRLGAPAVMPVAPAAPGAGAQAGFDVEYATFEYLLMAMIADTSKETARQQRSDGARQLLERLQLLEDAVRSIIDRLAASETEAERRWTAMEQMILAGLAMPVDSRASTDSTSAPQ